MFEVPALRAYGFGDKFIQYFNTLHNGLSVKVLVNGFLVKKLILKGELNRVMP
jgi:hypothetical protein